METIAPSPAFRRHEQGLRLAGQRLAASPDDPELRFELAWRLDRLGRADQARQAYLDVLARDMRHAGALRHLAILLEASGFATAARTVLLQAVAAHPGDAGFRASLGHLLRVAGDDEAARAHYQAALRIDPAQPEAHQGLCILLEEVDAAAAERHRLAGFRDRVLTSSVYRGRGRPVVVLHLVSARGGNVVTRHLLDGAVFLTHTLVVEYAAAGMTLPPHDLVFNAIGDAERCADALDRAPLLLCAARRPVLNAPARIALTGRAANADRLGRLEDVTTPRLATLPRAGFAQGPPPPFGFPFLLRSPGFHTGQHFERIETLVQLERVLASLPGDRLTAIEPLAAPGPDGFWRKYRVMMVAGRLLPLHLAISPDWKVHHFTAGMQDRPAHRAEEAAFLADMPAILGPRAMRALARIDAALGLDYGGIDFALGAKGEVLLFEANATMAVAPPVPGSPWAYRAPAARAVIACMQAHLIRIAARHSRASKPRCR